VRRVFVDSGAFFALLVPQDAFHAAATTAFGQAEAERWELITTNVVVIEAYALLIARTRPGRLAAIGFLDALAGSSVHVERIDRRPGGFKYLAEGFRADSAPADGRGSGPR
jgi:predicted nucleic acid-binding protein